MEEILALVGHEAYRFFVGIASAAAERESTKGADQRRCCCRAASIPQRSERELIKREDLRQLCRTQAKQGRAADMSRSIYVDLELSHGARIIVVPVKPPVAVDELTPSQKRMVRKFEEEEAVAEVRRALNKFYYEGSTVKAGAPLEHKRQNRNNDQVQADGFRTTGGDHR
jgi:hypothetical protein